MGDKLLEDDVEDLMLIVRDKFLNTLMKITQRILKLVETQCAKTRLSVNPIDTDVSLHETLLAKQKLPSHPEWGGGSTAKATTLEF